MKIFQNLRSLLPIPGKWSDEGKNFAMRVEDAYKWMQTQQQQTQQQIEQIQQDKAMKFADRTAEDISDLDDIPLGSWGQTNYAASVSPLTTRATANTICLGLDDDNKALFLVGTSAIYVNIKSNGTWLGWKQGTLTSV